MPRTQSTVAWVSLLESRQGRRDVTHSSSELVAGLVDSSELLGEPIMDPYTWTIWVLFMFIMIVLILLIIVFYIWPEVISYYEYRKQFPCKRIIPSLLRRTCRQL